MTDSHWVLRYNTTKERPADGSAYLVLIAAGYKQTREEIRHGWTWVLLTKEVEK